MKLVILFSLLISILIVVFLIYHTSSNVIIENINTLPPITIDNVEKDIKTAGGAVGLKMSNQDATELVTVFDEIGLEEKIVPLGATPFSFVGVYRDSIPRAIPNAFGNRHNVNSCIQKANQRGDTVLGIQAGSECWTGTDLGKATTKYPGLPNNRYTKTQGGNWINAVYARSPLQSITMPDADKDLLQGIKNAGFTDVSTIKTSIMNSEGMTDMEIVDEIKGDLKNCSIPKKDMKFMVYNNIQCSQISSSELKDSTSIKQIISKLETIGYKKYINSTNIVDQYHEIIKKLNNIGLFSKDILNPNHDFVSSCIKFGLTKDSNLSEALSIFNKISISYNKDQKKKFTIGNFLTYSQYLNVSYNNLPDFFKEISNFYIIPTSWAKSNVQTFISHVINFDRKSRNEGLTKLQTFKSTLSKYGMNTYYMYVDAHNAIKSIANVESDMNTVFELFTSYYNNLNDIQNKIGVIPGQTNNYNNIPLNYALRTFINILQSVNFIKQTSDGETLMFDAFINTLKTTGITPQMISTINTLYSTEPNNQISYEDITSRSTNLGSSLVKYGYKNPLTVFDPSKVIVNGVINLLAISNPNGNTQTVGFDKLHTFLINNLYSNTYDEDEIFEYMYTLGIENILIIVILFKKYGFTFLPEDEVSFNDSDGNSIQTSGFKYATSLFKKMKITTITTLIRFLNSVANLGITTPAGFKQFLIDIAELGIQFNTLTDQENFFKFVELLINNGITYRINNITDSKHTVFSNFMYNLKIDKLPFKDHVLSIRGETVNIITQMISHLTNNPEPRQTVPTPEELTGILNNIKDIIIRKDDITFGKNNSICGYGANCFNGSLDNSVDIKSYSTIIQNNTILPLITTVSIPETYYNMITNHTKIINDSMSYICNMLTQYEYNVLTRKTKNVLSPRSVMSRILVIIKDDIDRSENKNINIDLFNVIRTFPYKSYGFISEILAGNPDKHNDDNNSIHYGNRYTMFKPMVKESFVGITAPITPETYSNMPIQEYPKYTYNTNLLGSYDFNRPDLFSYANM